jgi:hypothetical protein
MCEVSEKLKLCTCEVASVGELENYWVLHRLVKGKDQIVVGRSLLRPRLDEDLERWNHLILLARLNEPDTFDVDLEAREGDRLLLVFRKDITYGFQRERGRWVPAGEPYDHLAWARRHVSERFGEVRAALKNADQLGTGRSPGR